MLWVGVLLREPPPSSLTSQKGEKETHQTQSTPIDISKESCSNNRKVIGNHRKGAQRRERSSVSSPGKSASVSTAANRTRKSLHHSQKAPTHPHLCVTCARPHAPLIRRSLERSHSLLA